MHLRGDLRVASTRDVAIHVHDLGGAGDPLLICHATGFCGRTYEPLAAELTSEFHVWAMDFRGHGLSDAPEDGDYSWGRMSEDVHAVSRVLSDAGVRVLGHSMGGAAALLAEARWPGTVAAAYVFEPAIVHSSDHTGLAAMMSEQTLRRTSAFRSRDEARDHLKGRPTFATWNSTVLDAFVEHGFADQEDGSVSLRCTPETEAKCYTSSTSCLADVIGIRIPLTVGAGLAPGPFGAILSARSLTEAIPDAHLAEHAGLGHFGPFESPGTVADAARQAVSRGSSEERNGALPRAPVPTTVASG